MISEKAQQKKEKIKQKRWGKKFEDKRNWKEYNEKAHIAVDVKTKKTLAIEITDETVSDSDKFDDLINQTEQNIKDKKIERVLGDGGYDDKDCFNILSKKKIESGIKTRINAITRSRGSPYRAKCVRERKELGVTEVGGISTNMVNAGSQKAYFLL